jgi:hypothetical protein
MFLGRANVLIYMWIKLENVTKIESFLQINLTNLNTWKNIALLWLNIFVISSTFKSITKILWKEMRCYFFGVVTPPGTSTKELLISKPLCDILLVFLQQEVNDVQRHVNTLGGLFTFLITTTNNNTHFEVFLFLHLKLQGCFDLVNLRHKQINKENNLFGN